MPKPIGWPNSMNHLSLWDKLNDQERGDALSLAGLPLDLKDKPITDWQADQRAKAALGVSKMNRVAKVFNGPAPVRPAPKMNAKTYDTPWDQNTVDQDILNHAQYHGGRSLDELLRYYSNIPPDQIKVAWERLPKVLQQHGRR